MVFALLLVAVGGASRVPGPVDPPSPRAVRVGAPLSYLIREIPLPQAMMEHEDGSATVRVRGRKLRVRPTDEFSLVQEVMPGDDGSLLVRERTRTDGGYVNDSIRVEGEVRPVSVRERGATVTEYRDTRNYVGYYYENPGVREYHVSPPTAFAHTEGRLKILGVGRPIKSWGPEEVVVEVPVDAEGRPSGIEFTEDTVLRLYLGGKDLEIGRYWLVGALPDRTLVVAVEGTVLFWRRGRFLSAQVLPAQWEPLQVNLQGEVLVRHRVPDGPGDHTVERRWAMGILRGDTIRPVAFSRPRSSRHLLWRTTYAFGSDGRVRLSAFLYNTDKAYELRPAR